MTRLDVQLLSCSYWLNCWNSKWIKLSKFTEWQVRCFGRQRVTDTRVYDSVSGGRECTSDFGTGFQIPGSSWGEPLQPCCIKCRGYVRCLPVDIQDSSVVKSIQLWMDGSKVGRAHGYFEAIREVGGFVNGWAPLMWIGVGCVGCVYRCLASYMRCSCIWLKLKGWRGINIASSSCN